MTANFIQESGLNPGINEIAPVVPGSRGGFGLPQFTGPRRVAFERFARERGVPLDDVDAQLDFIFDVELPTTERRAAQSFFAAETPEEAALAVSRDFLRPGKPNNARRVSEAQRLANQFAGIVGGEQPAPPPDTAVGLSRGQDAAGQPQAEEENGLRPALLDVADFQTQGNAFASALSPDQVEALTRTNFLTRRLRNGA
jgi:hypothetical protein